MKVYHFVFLVFLLFAQSAWGDKFSDSYEFKPIHIDRNELLRAVTEIFSYVQKVNGQSILCEGYIELGQDHRSTRLNLPLQRSDYEKFPRISYRGIIKIEAPSSGVISDVELWFSDDLRTLTTSGTSRDHIAGLIKVAQDKISDYEITGGGPRFRLFIGIIFFVVSATTAFVIFYSRNLPRSLWLILFISANVFINMVLYVPPWERVFPGFIAGTESMSFFEKNAPLFTFFALAIQLLLLIPTLISWFKKNIKASS